MTLNRRVTRDAGRPRPRSCNPGLTPPSRRNESDRRPKVALIAAAANRSTTAVGARMAAFASALSTTAWHVDVVDVAPPHPSKPQELIEQWLHPRLRTILDALGFEGDVLPSVAWHARSQLRQVQADVAVISVPPFSLLGFAVAGLSREIPLVLDYRDPWSGRVAPPPLARVTRHLECLAVQRAAKVTYAGGGAMGSFLSNRLRIPPTRLTSMPNGHDAAALEGLQRHRADRTRNGSPLDLVFAGCWYGRNGPGILVDALRLVGSEVATLTAVGEVSPTIAAQIRQASQDTLRQVGQSSRKDLYRRLYHADAAIMVLDDTCAVESRLPAKMYDYLAVGVPVIAVCPRDAALLKMCGAERVHHVDDGNVDALTQLLRQAQADRGLLRSGVLGDGPSRDQGCSVLSELLLELLR